MPSPPPVRRRTRARDRIGDANCALAVAEVTCHAMPNTNLRADRFSGYVTGTTVAVDGGIGRYNWLPRPWPRIAALLAAPVLDPSASPRAGRLDGRVPTSPPRTAVARQGRRRYNAGKLGLAGSLAALQGPASFSIRSWSPWLRPVRSKRPRVRAPARGERRRFVARGGCPGG